MMFGGSGSLYFALSSPKSSTSTGALIFGPTRYARKSHPRSVFPLFTWSQIGSAARAVSSNIPIVRSLGFQ